MMKPVLAVAVLTFGVAHAEEEPVKLKTPPTVANAGSEEAETPTERGAGRLIAAARKLREEQGCAASAPTYRVVAAMGEGQEAAQHELGECLLSMTGASETETALFREEGVLWLKRAAFAGNARAQRKLAVDMAAPANPLHDVKGALQWALVYAKNPTSALYGYGPLPATMAPGLKSALSADDVAAAEKFASEFAPLAMAKYEAPKVDKEKRPTPPPGARPRRPGIGG